MELYTVGLRNLPSVRTNLTLRGCHNQSAISACAISVNESEMGEGGTRGSDSRLPQSWGYSAASQKVTQGRPESVPMHLLCAFEPPNEELHNRDFIV